MAARFRLLNPSGVFFDFHAPDTRIGSATGGDCDTPDVLAVKPLPQGEKEDVTPGSESSSRILVVDDDPMIRTLLTDLLTHDGFEVDAAENAQAALTLLLKHRYSLLTTDLDFPGPSGLDLIRAIRGRGLLLPILVLSGDREAVLGAAVQDLGRAECIFKPFGIDAVRAAVARLLTPVKPTRTRPTETQ